MLYLSFRPVPPLNEFVDYFWLIDGGQSPRLEKILPSGTNELVVNLKNNEIHIHEVDQPDRYRRFAGAVFSGTYSRSFVCNALQHEAMMGVHFRPGGAFSFLGTEASELTNAHANLADLWGRSGVELRERLCTAATSQQLFQIMERALRVQLRQHSTSKLQMKIALQLFAMRGNRNSIRDVSRELGFSQRRFIQMFNSHVGLTPKVFCRIQRFQRARVLAEKLKTPHWAKLAVACGYFDQSHLIKDFQEFAGSTPRRYSAQQNHKDTRLKDNHLTLCDE